MSAEEASSAAAKSCVLSSSEGESAYCFQRFHLGRWLGAAGGSRGVRPARPPACLPVLRSNLPMPAHTSARLPDCLPPHPPSMSACLPANVAALLTVCIVACLPVSPPCCRETLNASATACICYRLQFLLLLLLLLFLLFLVTVPLLASSQVWLGWVRLPRQGGTGHTVTMMMMMMMTRAQQGG